MALAAVDVRRVYVSVRYLRVRYTDSPCLNNNNNRYHHHTTYRFMMGSLHVCVYVVAACYQRATRALDSVQQKKLSVRNTILRMYVCMYVSVCIYVCI